MQGSVDNTLQQMMKYLLLLLFNLLTAVASAQQLYGVVKDATTGERLPAVFVENRSSGAVTNTDTNGAYTIAIKRGDALYFHLTGYTTVIRVVADDTWQQYGSIMMKQQVISIDTVTISGLSPYQQDSLERRAVFGKKVDQKPARFGFDKKGIPSSGYGVVFNNPVSSVYQKFSRKYKRLRAFQRRFRENEQQLFLDARYTPALVQELTGISEDSARLFIYTYTIPYDFARAATEIELSMWVKFNYRIWISKEKAEVREK